MYRQTRDYTFMEAQRLGGISHHARRSDAARKVCRSGAIGLTRSEVAAVYREADRNWSTTFADQASKFAIEKRPSVR